MKLQNKYPALTLEVTLLDMPKPVWRTIVVRTGTSMRELHHIIQAIMPWSTSHLYEFTFNTASSGEEIRIGDTELWEEDMPFENDDRLFYIEDVVQKKGDKVKYLYDIGDNWMHEIKLIDIDDDPFFYPVLPCILDGKGQCPPEDCGGAPEYKDMLEIISNPKNPDYEFINEWLSGLRWKPSKFNAGKLQKLLNRYKDNMWQQYIG